MKYVFFGINIICLISILSMGIYIHPAKQYRHISNNSLENKELSEQSEERIIAIAKTYPHDQELFNHLQEHFPIFLNTHIIRCGNEKQILECDIDQPIAYIHETDSQEGLILFAQGAIMPCTVLAKNSIERLPHIIIKNRESFDELSIEEKIAIGNILTNIGKQAQDNHTIICIDKTLFILQDTDNTYQIWYSPKTPLSFIQKALTYTTYKKSLNTHYQPYSIETRMPKTIIIKNKSKGWIPS